MTTYMICTPVLQSLTMGFTAISMCPMTHICIVSEDHSTHISMWTHSWLAYSVVELLTTFPCLTLDQSPCRPSSCLDYIATDTIVWHIGMHFSLLCVATLNMSYDISYTLCAQNI